MGHINLLRAQGDQDLSAAVLFVLLVPKGFASGSAIFKRWGAPLNLLPQDSPAWDMQAHYLAELCHTLTLAYSPQKIILGG